MKAAYEWGDDLPTLTAERVVLRALTDADVPALFEVFSDPEVMRYWSRAPFTSMADAVRLLHDIRECFRTRQLFQWGIAQVADDRVVGTCTLFRIDTTHRRAEVGFALARSAWGRGLASEVLATALRFAFETLDLHRVEADADPRNERSLRLLERHGFRREGHLRERYQVSGEIQDAVILGLLRPEWSSR